MEPVEVDSFLKRLIPETTETVTWPNGLSFEVTSHLTSLCPPSGLVTSVRAVILSDAGVLVVRDPTSVHTWPGGRIEPGESWLDALAREIAEETGWTVHAPRYLGFLHFHHRQPRPDRWYGFTYPDFFQVIYCVVAGQFHPELREKDGYEIESTFQSVTAVREMSLTKREHLFLEEGLRRTRYA